VGEELAVQFSVIDLQPMIDYLTVNARMLPDTGLGEERDKA
jgi:hypothetical protein